LGLWPGTPIPGKKRLLQRHVLHGGLQNATAAACLTAVPSPLGNVRRRSSTSANSRQIYGQRHCDRSPNSLAVGGSRQVLQEQLGSICEAADWQADNQTSNTAKASPPHQCTTNPVHSATLNASRRPLRLRRVVGSRQLRNSHVSQPCESSADVAAGNMKVDAASQWWATLTPHQAAVEREWHTKLSPLQFKVLRMKCTEDINSGPLLHWFAFGSYACAGCGALLYHDVHKIPTTCGWPAFKDSRPGALRRQEGKRVPEITCSSCDGHIGHVFKSERYPPPHHERHCVNSASLRFLPATSEGDVLQQNGAEAASLS